MLPDPLHPAIVHLPIALAVLLPLFALVATLVIARGALPTRAWGVVVLLALVLVLSSWAALETGEQDEERAEEVVAERFIEAHEEAAEQFMVVGVLVLLASLAGLHGGRAGDAARSVSVLLAFGLLASGIQVGHRGGALVYEHGAATAYAGGPTEPDSTYRSRAGGVLEFARHRGDHDDHEDEDDD